jgi:hypothetical protein
MTSMSANVFDAIGKARFDITNFTRIMGAPEHKPIDFLENETTTVAATFKTTWYNIKPGAPPSLSLLMKLICDMW